MERRTEDGQEVREWDRVTSPSGPRCLLVGSGERGPALETALRGEGFRPRRMDRLREILAELTRQETELLLVAGACEDVEPLGLLEVLDPRGMGMTILFMADRSCPGLARSALNRGADDVVAPPHSASSIALRYHIAAMRSTLPSPAPRRRIHLGEREVDLKGRRLLDGGRPVSLTGREYQLLARLLAARGEVVERDTLFHDIWDRGEASMAALEATVHRLRSKLEKDSTGPRLLTTIRGVGYRLELPEEDRAGAQGPSSGPALEGPPGPGYVHRPSGRGAAR